MCIQAFFIRGGQNWGHRSFFPVHTAEVPEDEVLMQFLVQFYEDVPPAPLRARATGSWPRVDLIAEALTQRIGRKVRIEVPQRGEPREAHRAGAAQCGRSAGAAAGGEQRDRQGAQRNGRPVRASKGRRTASRSTTTAISRAPNALGAMIVAGPEGFRKNAYRKFNIKKPETIAGDDFGMMREVFERRFGRVQEEDPDRETGEWPDLVLVDGGKGQLNAATPDPGRARHRGRADGRRRQGAASWPRRPRGLPPARRARS